MTPAANALLARLPELLAEIQRGRVPSWARSHLAEHLQLSLEQHRGRAEGALRASAARSLAVRSRIRDAIRDAVGALPIEVRDFPLPVVLRQVMRRLGEQAPSKPVVRDELKRMRREILETSELERLGKRASVTAGEIHQEV